MIQYTVRSYELFKIPQSRPLGLYAFTILILACPCPVAVCITRVRHFEACILDRQGQRLRKRIPGSGILDQCVYDRDLAIFTKHTPYKSW